MEFKDVTLEGILSVKKRFTLSSRGELSRWVMCTRLCLYRKLYPVAFYDFVCCQELKPLKIEWQPCQVISKMIFYIFILSIDLIRFPFSY